MMLGNSLIIIHYMITINRVIMQIKGRHNLDYNLSISYSIAVFFIILFSASVLNLIKQHYVFQIIGITFLFLYSITKITLMIRNNEDIIFNDIYFAILPALSAIAACFVGMSLGFWVFPFIRKKFKS